MRQRIYSTIPPQYSKRNWLYNQLSTQKDKIDKEERFQIYKIVGSRASRAIFADCTPITSMIDVGHSVGIYINDTSQRYNQKSC